MAYIISSGEVSSGIILEYNSMTILDGGTANSTTVNYVGYLYVSSGGTANSTTVNSKGNLFVSSGGTANSTIVNTAGWGNGLYVSYGGTANETTINGDCKFFVDGGTVNNTNVNAGGIMTFHRGRVNNTTVNLGGFFRVMGFCCTANNTTINSGGSMCVDYGTINSVIVNSGGTLSILDGSAADVVWMPFEGTIDISERAHITFAGQCSGAYYGSGNELFSHAQTIDLQTLSKASMYVMSDGAVNGTTVKSGGTLAIFHDGTGNNITVDSGGKLVVYNGGSVTDVVWMPFEGTIDIANNAHITFASQCSGVYYGSGNELFTHAQTMDSRTISNASMHVMSDGIANGAVVSKGMLTLYYGGTADSATVNSGGYFAVSSGGTANDTTVNSQGSLIVSSGGTAIHTTVNSQGFLGVSAGGKADSATVNGYYDYYSPSCGILHVSSEGTANNTIVDSGGNLYVFSGGTATSTTVNVRGSMFVISDGIANSTTVSGGTLYISSGGTATNIIWTPSEGQVIVSDGAVVTFVSQYSGVYYGSNNHLVSNAASMSSMTIASANMVVMSGGFVNDMTINFSGNLSVFSGGTADSTTINTYSGGLFIADGGAANHTVINGGRLTLCNGVTANYTTLNGGGHLTVSSGGTANVITVNSGGNLYVSDGGTANSTTVNGYGSLQVYGGGTANVITANSGGSLYVSSGGTANSTTVNGNASLQVYGGGTANRTMIGCYGSLTISSGGIANSTTVYYGGHLDVSSGGTATIAFTPWQGSIVSGEGASISYLERDVNVYYGNTSSGTVSSANTMSGLFISSGFSTIVYQDGLLDGVTVSGNGTLIVSSGGSANFISINSGGNLSVSSGGTASIVFTPLGQGSIVSGEGASISYLERNANVYYGNTTSGTVSSANTMSGLSISSGFSAIVYQDGLLDGVTVFESGALTVSSGGSANNTTVNYWGSMHVSGGGSANIITLNAGRMYVSSGGTANSTTVNNGSLFVSSGGTANSTTVNFGGYLYISPNGTATEIIENSGYVEVEDGTNVTFLANTLSGLTLERHSATVHSGTTANSTTVNVNGILKVYSGGTANSTTVNNGSLFVSSGGTANSTTVNSGSLYVYNGGTAVRTTVSSGTVSIGGLASIITMSGGSLDVLSGGTAVRTTVSSGTVAVSGGGSMNGVTMREGRMTMFDGGMATSVYVYGGNLTDGNGSYTPVYSAAELTVSGGAVVNSTTVNGGFVYLNGTANDVALRGSTYMSGKLFVNNGGTANNIIMSGGSLFVSNGGTANNVAVENGLVTVSYGGIVNGMSVSSGGSMAVSGGKLTGQMSFADKASVVATKSWEATIDFDLTHTAPGSEILVDNLSVIQGDFLYSLTVKDSQKRGLYSLAANADGFYSTISIVNTAGTKLGSVGVGETIMVGEADYTLNLENGVLTLLVDRFGDEEPPTVSNVKANNTSPTNQSVTVTAEFADDVELDSALYRIGTDGAWLDYPTGGVTVTENATVCFKAIDAAGNESEIAYYEVTNIDKSKPTVSNVKANITTQTNQSVTITASFADDVELAQSLYRLGEAGEWKAYENGVTVTENTTVYFKAIDAVGNESELASYSVTNITENSSSSFVLENSSSIVYAGMLRSNTTINSRGWLRVSSGGTATSTTVNSGGLFTVYGGGTAAGNTVNSGGSFSVLSGGLATDTTVNSSGWFHVSSGGTANNITVNSGGWLRVSSGGTATEIVWTPCEGDLYVFEGAVATFASEYSGVYYGSTSLLSHATTIDGVNIDNHGKMYVMSGGTANNTTINSGGTMFVSRGGLANSTTVNANQALYVSSGGTATNTMIESWGSIFIFDGGTANDTTVNIGWMHVSSGGYVSKVLLLGQDDRGEGDIYIFSGGIVEDVTVGDYGDYYVYGGGTANKTTVNSTGNMEISSGGTATEIIENGGCVKLSDGAQATFIANSFSGLVLSGWSSEMSGYIRDSASVHSGTTAFNTTIYSDGDLTVYSGGTANDTTVNSGGKLTISKGGTATVVFNPWGGGSIVSQNGATVTRLKRDANVYYGGVNDGIVSKADTMESLLIENGNSALVYSGGYAAETTVDNGWIHISKGGTANSTMLNSDGTMYVSNGGMATDITVSGGMLNVFNGGMANSTTVHFGGRLNVSNGGMANSTMLNSGGTMYVSNGGTATDTIASSGGELYISDGGKVTGKMTFEDGATVTMEEGAVLDFDLRQTSAGAAALVNGLSFVQGTLSCTLTVDESLKAGSYVYSLADGASEFNSPISVVNAADDALGALVVGQSITLNRTDYTLNLENGILSLLVEQGDYVLPTVSNVAENISATTNYSAITVTASFADDVELASSLYRIGENGEWKAYENGVTVTENTTIYFKAIDAAGNESEIVSYMVSNIVAAPTGLRAFVDGQDVALVWSVKTEDIGTTEYVVKYSLDGRVFTATTKGTSYVLNNADYGTYSWSVQAVDFAGNESEITVGDVFTVSDFKPYIVEYSTDNFEHTFRFSVTTPTLNTFRMPGGTYQMRVMQKGSNEWTTGDTIVAAEFDDTPQLVKSDADGNSDVFFANPVGTWELGYAAQHVGSINDWAGTNEYAAVYGKNKLADIFEGSTDANILLMTDDDNGDTLFVDDIYTALPGTVGEQQARIARIDEIRAGAGDDIVDMTSQRFEYTGDGLTIRGGNGNDVIWANKGDNRLFGDAGNDRIVGASGDDVMVGGIGNDSLHGGGGDDVFAFCDNWGVDTVEQLADGKVTLWFASGDESNWNAETLTYTDGENSVTVSGVSAEQITLKLGDDGSAQFASLSNTGAFDAFTSQRIFEESDSGILASL